MEHAITIGRYLLHRQIARGGMATIHIARLIGDEGFTRIVAAKRLHPEFAEDTEFVQMFLDEARVASKVNHRNVVPVLDVVHDRRGGRARAGVRARRAAALAAAHARTRRTTHVPINVAVSIACQVLAGLARRARHRRRARHAARHRASRRVAAERHGRDRRHRAPARLRRREGIDGGARHAQGHVQGQARVLGAGADPRPRDARRAMSTRSPSCCGSCSSGTACTAARKPRPSWSARS